MRDLPTGTVTFLFTDIESSTQLLQELGEAYAGVQDAHAMILRKAISEGAGSEIRTEATRSSPYFPPPSAGCGRRWRPSVDCSRRTGLTAERFGCGWDCTRARGDSAGTTTWA